MISARSRRAQAGMSLVEIMVAMTISVILLTGVSQIFLNSKQTYTLQDGLARAQENGRFALEILSRDLRMAGYLGCANLANITPNNIALNAEADAFSATAAVGGGLANVAEANGIAGTDAIEVRRASEASINLLAQSATNSNVQIQGNPMGFAAGNILMVTDCQNADIFAATGVSSAAGIVTIAHAGNANEIPPFLSTLYGNNAELMHFRAARYFLATTNRTSTTGRPITALYHRNLVTNALNELVEGIEAMRVLYGVDTSGDRLADTYMSTAEVETAGAWGRIISARIALLVASAEEVKPTDETRSYDLLGTDLEITDRRVRRVFTATVTLRNRTR